MITANDIVKANEVLKNVVERTPLDFDRYLSEKYGATIYIKKENMQKVRSFKLRGAYYAIHQLSDEDKARGVVCASAGNHAQGVAYTCNEMKIPATIFMPVTTPLQKIGQVRFFGGKFVTIKLVGDTFDASAQAAQEYTKSEGMTFIDPFDDYNVQAGQGTVAYEIYEQAQEEGVSFDSILVPVGGGGLISGVATYIKDVAPSMEVIGVEASGARSMRAAFDRGYPVKLEEIDKFADGIAVQKVGAKTYEVARKYVDRLLGVDEGLISETLIDRLVPLQNPQVRHQWQLWKCLKMRLKEKPSSASFQVVTMTSTVCQRWKNVRLSTMVSSITLWLTSHNVLVPFVNL